MCDQLAVALDISITDIVEQSPALTIFNTMPRSILIFSGLLVSTGNLGKLHNIGPGTLVVTAGVQKEGFCIRRSSDLQRILQPYKLR